MRKSTIVKLLLLVLFTSIYLNSKSSGNRPILIHPEKVIKLKYREPSDITISYDGTNFYLPVDKAYVIQTDLNGKELKRAEFIGYDLEGICENDGKLYVSEESFRKIYQFDATTLKLEKTFPIQYNGAINSGFESITYLPNTHQFLLATEKSPQFFQLFDNNFQKLDQFTIPGIKEVSAMTWFNNSLWVLSDEQMTVFKVNSSNYTISGSWQLPIINPEGISFDKSGNMYIVSDDMAKMFVFKNPDL